MVTARCQPGLRLDNKNMDPHSLSALVLIGFLRVPGCHASLFGEPQSSLESSGFPRVPHPKPLGPPRAHVLRAWFCHDPLLQYLEDRAPRRTDATVWWLNLPHGELGFVPKTWGVMEALPSMDCLCLIINGGDPFTTYPSVLG